MHPARYENDDVINFDLSRPNMLGLYRMKEGFKAIDYFLKLDQNFIAITTVQSASHNREKIEKGIPYLQMITNISSSTMYCLYINPNLLQSWLETGYSILQTCYTVDP